MSWVLILLIGYPNDGWTWKRLKVFKSMRDCAFVLKSRADWRDLACQPEVMGEDTHG